MHNWRALETLLIITRLQLSCPVYPVRENEEMLVCAFKSNENISKALSCYIVTLFRFGISYVVNAVATYL